MAIKFPYISTGTDTDLLLSSYTKGKHSDNISSMGLRNKFLKFLFISWSFVMLHSINK